MKRTNEYALAAGADLFDRTPKAVWAAIAIAALSQARELDGAIMDGDTLKVAAAVADEWRVLHNNGIVPQKPPARLS